MPARAGGGASALLRALAAPLLLAVALQNVGNLVFHAVVGRALPAADYGALGAVLALMVMLTVPLGALQAAAAALVARHGWSAPAVRRTLSRTTMWSLLAAVVVLALAPAARGYFSLASSIDAALLAPFVLVSVVLAVGRGLLLGDSRVGATALTFVVAVAVRLAAGLPLALAWGVTGALVGTALGEVAGLALALVLVLRRSDDPEAEPGSLAGREVVISGVAVGGLFLFTTVDLLLARHYLDGDASGSYVAAATIAKTVLALPAAALAANYPRLVAAVGRSAWRATLARTAVVVVGLAAVAALAVAALPGLVLTVLYGSGFGDAAVLVRWLALVAGASAGVSVLTYAGLARRSWLLLVPWAGAVLEVVVIALRHDSALAVAQGSALALAATLLVMVAAELVADRRADGPAHDGRAASIPVADGRERGLADEVVADPAPGLPSA